MIVVDTNILAYLMIESERTAVVREVLTADAEWAAPMLWRSEFRNILSTYLRQSRMNMTDAVGFYDDAEALLLGREHLGDSRTILRLAEQSGHSAYDCEFIAVAKRLGVPLVTSDRKLCKSFPETVVSPDNFLSGA